jgi:hypothetical protein
MPSKMGHEKKANLPVADVLILFVAAFFCFPSALPMRIDAAPGCYSIFFRKNSNSENFPR